MPKTQPTADPRTGIAARKAELRKLIKKRSERAPPDFATLSFNDVERWKAVCKEALKRHDSDRSSIADLESALNKLAMFSGRKATS